MYVIELIVGVALILIGSAALVYFFYTKNRCDTSKVWMSVSEACATIVIGTFYVACAVLLAQKIVATKYDEVEEPTGNLSFVEIGAPQEEAKFFDERNFYTKGKVENNNSSDVDENKLGDNNSSEVDEYLEKYKKFFGDIVDRKVRNDSVRKFYYNNRLYENRGRSLEVEEETCDLDEVYLKYLMLIASFIYGLASLLSATFECKDCDVTNESKPQLPLFVQATTSVEQSSGRNNPRWTEKTKITARVASTWLLPILYTLIVHFTMGPAVPPTNLETSEIKPLPTDVMSIIAKPQNVTHPTNDELENVVGKVYGIVASAELNRTQAPAVMYDVVKHFNKRRPKQVENCEYEEMPLKLHTLVVFVAAYFTVLFYSKNEHTRLAERIREENVVGTLRKQILSFGIFWLPSVLEVFVRVFMMEYAPNALTDVCLAVGNVGRIFSNVVNVAFVRKLVQQRNNVKPLESESG